MAMTPSELAPFSDRLAAAVDARRTVACVGIDPVFERFPADMKPANPADHGASGNALRRFCDGVIEAVRGVVPVVKFQSACFERYGEHGVSALRQSIIHAKQAGLIVILDAKRGDIGITAAHYASAAFDGPSAADAITCSGYLGADTIEPMLKPGRGAFVLVRTSNPGSDGFQSLKLADGRSIAEAMADLVAGLGKSKRGARGLSDVGAVVGATKSAEAAALRARMPDTTFLIPGYGAQGGTIEDIRPCVRAGSRGGEPSRLGVLVTASRSVIYPDLPKGAASANWRLAVGASARKLVEELRAL
jgi:orotidine-5'-phosphate decarboxylase